MINYYWLVAWVGALLQLFSRATGKLIEHGILHNSFISNDSRIIVLLFGNIIIIVALALISKSKGRSLAWGILGFFSLIGMLIVSFLKYNKDLKEESDNHQVI